MNASNGAEANSQRRFVVTPDGVGASSQIYLVRPGIYDEIGKQTQHTIANSLDTMGPVLMHGHRHDEDCAGVEHWLVTADSTTSIDTDAVAVPHPVKIGLEGWRVPPPKSTTEPIDEHTEDVSLLKYTLRCAREEIVRLRAENDGLTAKLADLLADPLGLATGAPSVVTGDPATHVGVMLASIFATMPSRAFPGDAGFDLYVSRPATIEPGSFVDIHCDVAIQLPPDAWGFVVGRSSTIRNKGLLVAPGIIDSGYRGELFAGVWNLTGEAITVQNGERLAQFIPMPLLADGLVLKQREKLDDHPRGQAGLGSTGA